MYKVLVAALVAMPAAPTVAASPAPDAAKPTPQALDEMVCKRDTVVGSRVQKRRTCMTRREWNRLQDGTRDGMNDFLKKSTSGAPRSG